MPQINNPVIHSHKIAFFCIPKCANMSVKTALKNSFGIDKHEFASKNAIISLKNKGFLTFAIVRNPIDRAVSIYKHKIQNVDPESFKYYDYGFRPNMLFSDFVRILYDTPNSDLDIHFQSQSWQIMSHGKIIPQYVFRFEDLLIAWNNIQKIIKEKRDIEIEDLQHINKSSGPNPIIGSKTRSLLAKCFADDYTMLSMLDNRDD